MDHIACRCGWNGIGDHLCHRCGKVPGTRRFYEQPAPYSLAGVQMKLSVCETVGCDACWDQFGALLQAANAPRPRSK